MMSETGTADGYRCSDFVGGKSKLPVHIRIRGSGLPKDSTILAEQIRTLDRCRIGKYVGSLDNGMMRNIDEIIKISLGVNGE